MKHIVDYNHFLTESILHFNDAFKNIIVGIQQSDDTIASEVATLLLSNKELFSTKYTKAEYTIIPDKDDTVLFNNQPIRLGRLLGSFLPNVDKFKIERFVQLYKIQNTTEPQDKYKLDFYSGEQIDEGYRRENYILGYEGDINGSCMNDKFEFLELYRKNENIKLAVLLERDKICARTLIWKCTNGKSYFDRIYYRGIAHRESLRKKLLEESISPVTTNDLSVKIENNPEYYPYVDTFRYLDEDEMYLNNYKEDDSLILDRTDGTTTSSFYSDDDDDNDDYYDSISDIEVIERHMGYAIYYLKNKYLANDKGLFINYLSRKFLIETENRLKSKDYDDKYYETISALSSIFKNISVKARSPINDSKLTNLKKHIISSIIKQDISNAEDVTLADMKYLELMTLIKKSTKDSHEYSTALDILTEDIILEVGIVRLISMFYMFLGDEDVIKSLLLIRYDMHTVSQFILDCFEGSDMQDFKDQYL